MNVVDLHPDDLLDKEAHGDLTEPERARLEAHLERCATCRFERDVRADFADELGLAEDEDDGAARRVLPLVGETLVGAMPARLAESPEAPKVPETREDFVVEPPVPERMPSSRPAAVRRNTRLLLLVAAALLIGTAATAKIGGSVWAAVSDSWSEREEHGHVAAPAASATPRIAVVTTATAEPGRAATAAAVEEAPVVPAVITPVAMPPAESAATLFDAANAARRAGDYGRAMMLHRRLESTWPASREAHASYATVGRLLLDRGDAAGALAAFDAYQSKGPGPLDEAVLVGRATALERLGRADDARATWSSLLASFPDTPYAEHAHARIDGAHVR